MPGGAATYPPAYLAFLSPWCIEKRAASSCLEICTDELNEGVGNSNKT